MRGALRRWLWTVALAGVVTSGVAAQVAQVQPRRYGLIFRQGIPHITFSAKDLVDAQARKKLDSGLPQRLVVQHFVYVPGREAPIAVGGQSCRVVYDLWQATYRVQLELVGRHEQLLNLDSQDAVLERCLVIRDAPLGTPQAFPSGQRFHIASLIELNPLSKHTIARIRRWLARPGGGDSVDGNSFFGSFVSLFVNHRIGSAERSLRLRSQDFRVR